MSEELKPCPFCGGADLVFRQDESEDKPVMLYAWHVFCLDCHCHGRNNYPIGWCESKLAASQAWNDRKQDDASNTLIEEQAARIATLEKERDLAIESNYRQAGCIHQCSAHLGPDSSGMIEGLPLAVKHAVTRANASQARLSEAVKVLEGVCSEDAGRAEWHAAKAFIATLGENKNEK